MLSLEGHDWSFRNKRRPDAASCQITALREREWSAPSADANKVPGWGSIFRRLLLSAIRALKITARGRIHKYLINAI